MQKPRLTVKILRGLSYLADHYRRIGHCGQIGHGPEEYGLTTQEEMVEADRAVQWIEDTIWEWQTKHMKNIFTMQRSERKRK